MALAMRARRASASRSILAELRTQMIRQPSADGDRAGVVHFAEIRSAQYSSSPSLRRSAGSRNFAAGSVRGRALPGVIQRCPVRRLTERLQASSPDRVAVQPGRGQSRALTTSYHPPRRAPAARWAATSAQWSRKPPSLPGFNSVVPTLWPAEPLTGAG
jgi:hypothetical protein